MDIVLNETIAQAGLRATPLPDGLRIKARGDLLFFFNYGPAPVNLRSLAIAEQIALSLGSDVIKPSDVTILRRTADQP